MASSYKTFMKILKKWPVDKTKRDRDLGKYLRDSVKTIFTQGEITPVDETECGKKLQALDRLVSNTHFKSYPRQLTSSATGLNGEQCQKILSADFLEYLEYEDKGVVGKLIKKVKPKPVTA